MATSRQTYFREYKRKELKDNPDKVRIRARSYYNDTLKNDPEFMMRKREAERNYSDKLKSEIFAILGCNCVNCGFSDKRALQIDHINGGGNQERKNRGAASQYRFILTKLEEGSKDYQILCANCNWIKRAENNEINQRKLNN